MGRGLGVGVDRGGAVTVAVGVAVAVAVAVADAVAVAVAVAVGDGVGVGVPPLLTPPITPIEKSAGTGLQDAPKKLLFQNAFWSFPQGVPTQFAPLVFESNERPVPSPIGVTFNQ